MQLSALVRASDFDGPLREAMAPSWSCTTDSSIATFCSRVQSDGKCAIAWDAGAIAIGDSARIITALGDTANRRPVFVIVDMTTAEPALLQLLSAQLPQARYLIRGVAHWAEQFRQADEGRLDPPVHAHIMRELIPAIRPAAVGIVAAAAIVARRRTHPSDLAAAVQTPLRTLQWRLKELIFPPARDLLAMMLALHGCWRIAKLNWTAKRVAREAGFHSVEAWARYCERHADTRPGKWKEEGGYDVLFEKMRKRLTGKA